MLLEAIDLDSGYGNVQVLRNVCLQAMPGEVVAVVGPNGAGKTTLLKSLSGFVRVDSGDVLFRGVSIAGLKPEKVAMRGIRMVFEGHRVFPELTVADNLKLGRLLLNDPEKLGARMDLVYDVFPILRDKGDSLARDLSGGQQQLLALGQAFVGAPSLLLCDEPSLGVAHSLVKDIMKFLRRLADDGVGVIVVEQFLDSIMAVADRAVVLRNGSVIAEGAPSEFSDSRIRELFVG